MMRTTLDVAIAKPGGVPAQTRELDAELRDGSRPRRPAAGELPDARPRPKRPARRAATRSRSSRSSTPRSPPATDQIGDKRLTVEHASHRPRAHRQPHAARADDRERDRERRAPQPAAAARSSVDLARSTAARRALIIDSSGPPLDQHAVAQLAQPFKRLGQDRTGSQDGHGLGLSIVAAIAAAHGGRLDSTPAQKADSASRSRFPASTIQQLAKATE